MFKIFKLLQTKVLINTNGKSVLITGCDTGFGHQLALSLNERGFRVYATVYSNPDSAGAQKLVTSAKIPQQMVVLQMDVTNDEQVRQVYDKVAKDQATNDTKLWAVVNNAGFMMASRVEWGTMQHVQNIFNVNVFGMVRVTRTFLPLIKQSKGRVVNVSSVLGQFVTKNFSAYSMTKASVIKFSDTLRKEMNEFGVKVSTIMPGGFKSTGLYDIILSLTDRIWTDTDDDVKNSYGEKYYDNWKKQLQTELGSYGGTDSMIVVNDMIDAIVNGKPCYNYQPIGDIFFKVLTFMNLYLPDYVPETLEKLLKH